MTLVFVNVSAAVDTADRARSATLARDNAAGLQSVCQALLEKSLFITNRTELEELDDDRGIYGQGGGGSKTEGDGRGGGEEEECHGQGQAATAGGDGGGVSELEVSRSPSCQQPSR